MRQQIVRALLRWSVATAAGATFVGMALPAGPASADTGPTPPTAYSFTSDPGDYIGQGRSASYTAPAATIGLGGDAGNLTLSVTTSTEDWHVNIAAPRGEQLHPGVYEDAERAPFRTGRSPGLDVWGDGRGCNEVWGDFAINQVSVNDSGAVTLLDATFTQHCEAPKGAALHGSLQYLALPLSYDMVSDPGDYIGAGASKTYTGATSTFGLSGTAGGRLQYEASGLRDDWLALIAPPTGMTLAAGTYDTARFADATHAGLDVFGDGRGCNNSTGILTITTLVTGAGGNVTNLAATFTQHCEGAQPALHGTIHYYA